MNRATLEILYALNRPKSFWELLAQSRILLRDFVAELNDLYTNGFLSVQNGDIALTEKGKKMINLRKEDFVTQRCPKCRGKSIVFSGKFNDVLEEFKKIVKNRPKAIPEFFQGCTIPEDVIFRLALMGYYNDITDKDILLVGDDDMVSIALALTELPKRVVVVDIDPRLREFIEKINKERGFNIEFIEYDVAQPLPKELVNRFDVFSTEPLETTSGFLAFVSRGASSLKEGGVGYIGLTTQEVSFKRWREFEDALVKMGFAITDIIRDFSDYFDNVDENGNVYESFTKELAFNVGKNPGINWYKSSLIRVFSVAPLKPIKKWNESMPLNPVGKEDFTHPSLHKNCV